MSTITKERIANLIEFNSEGSDCQANAEQWEVHELARIALTSLEAEPVADVVAWSSQNEERTCDVRLRRHDIKPGILYTAPPAPVSVPEWTNEQCQEFLSIAFRHAEIKGDLELDDIRLGVKMVNGSRAAMLQGADGKPELTVWYGSMPETNGKTNWTAMLHRKGQHPWEGITIDCSEYPDRVRYEADRMRHLIGELADEPDILAYDADAHSGYVNPGNSQVTPDGWIPVSERMPDKLIPVMVMYADGEMWSAMWSGQFWDDGCTIPDPHSITHWREMPAAPQQEVN